MDKDTLLAFAGAYTSAWSSQDPAQVASHFENDGSLTINGGDPSSGRAAISAAAQSFMSTFPDLHLEMDSLESEGGRPAFRWTLTGTNAGPEGTVGNPVRISGCERWLIGESSLIADSLGTFDAEDYARQLGVG